MNDLEAGIQHQLDGKALGLMGPLVLLYKGGCGLWPSFRENNAVLGGRSGASLEPLYAL